jgi:hypothetical protein
VLEERTHEGRERTRKGDAMTTRAVVLFSGGSDCTLAAARVAASREFDEIVLLTYEVPVSCMETNSKRNIPHLQRAFPDVTFTHQMMPVGDIINKVITKRKTSFVFKHGLIESSFCLHCRLGMHVRTIMYCLDEGIADVFDGSNVTMAIWVDQTRDGLKLVDELYGEFGVRIQHPVFQYAGDDLFDLLKFMDEDELRDIVKKSTSHELYAMGILPEKDHKSDFLASYRAQPVCLGVVMSLMHSLGYSIPLRGYRKYQEAALAWYRDKTALFRELLKEYQGDRQHSELGALVKGYECEPQLTEVGASY